MFGNNKTHMHRHLFAVTYHAVIKLFMYVLRLADDMQMIGLCGHCLCINMWFCCGQLGSGSKQLLYHK